MHCGGDPADGIIERPHRGMTARFGVKRLTWQALTLMGAGAGWG
jgi:hypothetical protein